MPGSNRGRGRAPLFRPAWAPARGSGLAAWRAAQPLRPSAAARGYGPDWVKLRARVLRGEPCCRECARRGLEVPATVVDHVVPVRLAPQRLLDPTNLQALCRPCHDAKTNRADGGFGNRRGGG